MASLANLNKKLHLPTELAAANGTDTKTAQMLMRQGIAPALIQSWSLCSQKCHSHPPHSHNASL